MKTYTAKGAIDGTHDLVAGAGTPSNGWAFLEQGATMTLTKGDVVRIWGTTGILLVRAGGPTILRGPLNWRAEPHATWIAAMEGHARAKRHATWALLAAAGLAFLMFSTLGGTAWALENRLGMAFFALMSMTSLAAAGGVFFLQSAYQTSLATSVGLPRRKVPNTASDGGEDGVAALFVVAHNGTLDTAAAEGGGGGGDADGGGDGGGGGD